MEISEYLRDRFTLGLLLGLLVAVATWKSGFSARRRLRKDLRKVELELRELQGHLNIQLKINAQGNDVVQRELEELRKRNENLRVNIVTLQSKPSRAELRQAQVVEAAVRLMREQAPGFAPSWERVMRQAESEVEAAEGGFRKLVRRVLPGSGGMGSSGGADQGVAGKDV